MNADPVSRPSTHPLAMAPDNLRNLTRATMAVTALAVAILAAFVVVACVCNPVTIIAVGSATIGWGVVAVTMLAINILVARASRSAASDFSERPTPSQVARWVDDNDFSLHREKGIYYGTAIADHEAINHRFSASPISDLVEGSVCSERFFEIRDHFGLSAAELNGIIEMAQVFVGEEEIETRIVTNTATGRTFSILRDDGIYYLSEKILMS